MQQRQNYPQRAGDFKARAYNTDSVPRHRIDTTGLAGGAQCASALAMWVIHLLASPNCGPMLYVTSLSFNPPLGQNGCVRRRSQNKTVRKTAQQWKTNIIHHFEMYSRSLSSRHFHFLLCQVSSYGVEGRDETKVSVTTVTTSPHVQQHFLRHSQVLYGPAACWLIMQRCGVI